MKYVRYGAMLAAGLLSAPYLVGAALDQIAAWHVRSLLASFDESGDVAVGDIAVDTAHKRVIVRDFSSRSPTVTIKVGAMDVSMEPRPRSTLARLNIVAPAEARAASPIVLAQATGAAHLSFGAPAATGGTASADDVTVKSGSATYRIKHIELKGTPLSNADLAALFDAKATDTIEARLRKLTAASVLVSEVDVDWSAGGYDQHWVEHDIALTDVVAGKVGAGTVGNGILTATGAGAKDAAPSATRFEVASGEIAKLDLPAGVHAASAARANAGESLAPLFDTIALHNLTVTDGATKQSMTLALAKVTGGRARPTKSGLSSTLATIANSKPNDAATKAELADLAGSVAIATGELDDLRTATSGDPSTTGGSIKTVRFEGLADDRLARAHLDGLTVNGGDTVVRLASADAGGVLLGLAGPDGAAPANPVPPLVSAFTVDGLAVDATNKTDGQTKAPTHFKLAHAAFLSDQLEPDAVPQKASFAFEHATVDISPDDAMLKTLSTLGYSQLDLSGSAQSHYDAGSQTLTVDKFELAGKDMGDVGLKLELANVGKGIASSNPEVQKASVLAMLLKGMTLDIRNDGLFERAIKSKAAMDGTSVAEEKEKGINFASLMLPALMNGNAKIKTLGNAIADFIRDPKTLHVAIMPKRGLGMLDAAAAVNDPQAILDVIDIEASADK